MIKRFKGIQSAIDIKIVLVALAILAVALLLISSFANQHSSDSAKNSDQKESNSTAIANNFETPKIKAKHAVVYDKKNNTVLYTKNAAEIFPVASITKLLTAIVSLDELSAEDSVTITPSDLATEGSSGLIVGEVWNNRDLISFMLITSSNDSASALARTVSQKTSQSFTDLINLKASTIGLSEQSRWRNPTGLDVIDGQEASNYASAIDIVALLDYLNTTYPSIANSTGSKEKIFTSNLTSHTAETTNQLSGTLPHVHSAKTGFTYVSGGNLALSTSVGPAHEIYIVVLGSTYDERFTDVKNLYNYAEKLIQSN